MVEEKLEVQRVDAFEDIVDNRLAIPRKDGGKGVHREARIARGLCQLASAGPSRRCHRRRGYQPLRL